MSVLIKGMEMPEDCRNCPFEMYYMNCGQTRCRATGKILADFYKPIPFEGRAEECPLIEVPSHEFARCTCEDSVQENGITLISEWATKGIDLAGEYGKTIDDLIVFLRVSYGMRMIFDLIGKQPKDVSDEHTD